MLEIKTLVIGLEDKRQALSKLEVDFVFMDSAEKATGCMRRQRINGILSRWHLKDAPDGELLFRIRQAKPTVPIVAFIEPGCFDQEIAARSAGVTAVLSQDINESQLKATLMQLLGMSRIDSLERMKEPIGAMN